MWQELMETVAVYRAGNHYSFDRPSADAEQVTLVLEEGARVRAGVDPIARVQPRSAGMGEAFISLAAGSRPDSMSQPSVG